MSERVPFLGWGPDEVDSSKGVTTSASRIASLSIAAVEVKSGADMDHFEISSRLSPLKHAAKSHSGNVVVINRADNYHLLVDNNLLEPMERSQ